MGLSTDSIERSIERGEVASYGEVARALGISRPRMSQVMDLLLLSPAVQERVLFSNVSLRDLKWAVGEPEWGRQGANSKTGNGCRSQLP